MMLTRFPFTKNLQEKVTTDLTFGTRHMLLPNYRNLEVCYLGTLKSTNLYVRSMIGDWRPGDDLSAHYIGEQIFIIHPVEDHVSRFGVLIIIDRTFIVPIWDIL